MNLEVIEGVRLDKFLASKLDDMSRAKIQLLIKNGDVLINNVAVKPSYILKGGDTVYIKDLKVNDEVLIEENLDLEILHEDEDCMVLNKPAGVVVHPGEGGRYLKGTVANAVKSKVDVGVGDDMRPGIVHRLDKDTSGALIVAKTKKGYDSLIKQFQERNVFKSYLVLVNGVLEHETGIIDSPIGRDLKQRKKMAISAGAKKAISKYSVIDSFTLGEKRTFSLLEVQIKTGRTHQIRVHMAAIGHPVVGDVVYGTKSVNRFFKDKYGLNRQFLHAQKLEFISGDKKVKIKSPLAGDLQKILDNLMAA